MAEGSIILVTSSIAPDQSVPMLELRDPEARLRQYVGALAAVVGCRGVGGVVMVDNTNRKLDDTAIRAVSGGGAPLSACASRAT